MFGCATASSPIVIERRYEEDRDDRRTALSAGDAATKEAGAGAFSKITRRTRKSTLSSKTLTKEKGNEPPRRVRTLKREKIDKFSKEGEMKSMDSIENKKYKYLLV